MVRERLGSRKLIAVVKADAYGLGLKRCARIYHEAGADMIAVAALSEADRLRSAVPAARILLLGSPLPEERSAIVASGYEVCCSTRDELQEFASLATAQRPQPVHLWVDTGMGRSGCSPAQVSELASLIRDTPTLLLRGLASHYPDAINAAVSEPQEALMRAAITAAGPLDEGCWVHCANSEAVLARSDGPGSAARVGLLLTGVVPNGCEDPGLELAVRWLSSVSLVKELPAGHGISYTGASVLQRDSVVALVPVGYADGYPFGCSTRSQVLIEGRRCPLLGRVTMDYLVVDVTDCPRRPVPGEPVTLLGEQGDDCIGVHELAMWAGTIPYDILCGLRGRCEIVGVP